MISFEGFAAEADLPIYLQIVRFIKRGAAAGAIADGDDLPSRRTLSALLSVNPNTVQKAYHLLEEEGLVRSRPGAGSCMALCPEALERLRRELLESEGRAAILAMKRAGMTQEQAITLIHSLWEEVSL